jgi:hypothetical protein
MKLRPWILGALLLAGVGVNLYLVLDERVVESERTVRHAVESSDPLQDISYTKGNRKTNLQRFGLTEPEVGQAFRRLEDLDDPDGRRRSMLAMFLDQAGDQTRVDKVFCGSGQVRPRYAALAYLIKDEGGKRMALDIRRVSGLEVEGWSKTARIAEVYGELELAAERKPDATVMGIAAILLGREQDVIDHSSFWGEGLRGRWSWENVKEEHPGIEERVVEYLALMHLTLEVAGAEGGFCSQ